MESQVRDLKEKIATLTPAEEDRPISIINYDKEDQTDLQPSLLPKSSILPRTCYELRLTDPINFKPGSYRIDPMGLGADSIPVTCNEDGFYNRNLFQ